MSVFTITEVSTEVRDWSSQQGGPMKEYRVHLKPQGNSAPEILNVEWSRRASSPPPQKDQQIDGELEDRGAHGFKFKAATGGGMGPRPEDPKRAARILRQHSQHMALRTIDLLQRTQKIDLEPLSSEQIRALISRWTDWFDDDAERAAQ